jgi:surfactin family lipopeptide synthetase A
MLERFEQVTIQYLLHHWAMLTPDAMAISAPGRASLTYSMLWDHIRTGALALNSFGVGRGDHIAIVLPQGPELAVAVVTITAVAAAAPFNPGAIREEFERGFDELAPKALIVRAGDSNPARGVAQERGILVIELLAKMSEPAGIFSLKGLQKREKPDELYALPDDTALVLSTSATTAKAKFVPLTHRNVRAAADNTSVALNLGPQDRCLVAATLFHAHGLVAGMMSSLMAGATAICPPTFDTEAFFACLDELQPSWYTAVPTVHQAILREAPRHMSIVARQRLRFIRSASAYLPDTTRAELEKVFKTIVVEGYGLTEAMQLTNTPLDPNRRKIGSLGVVGTSEIGIMDESGHLLGPSQSGEIVARGPVVTAGYLNLPDINISTFHNGWFKTGDVGYIDDDGHLYMTGRIKDQINRGGEKISPQEIDRVLLNHPDVLQALAFGMDHPTLGEEVAAAIVLRPGTVVSPDEIRNHAKSRLQDFKVPRRVFIVPALPENTTGKLLRRDLAAHLGELKERPIYVAPRNPLEQELVEIWEDLLAQSPLGIHDNFFDMGGQSLIAAQVISRIRRDFQVQVPVRLLFERPTVAQLSEALPIAQKYFMPIIAPVSRQGNLRLSFAQQRLWFLEQIEPVSTAYSMPEAYRLLGPLDIEAMRQTIEVLVGRHEVLRTSFHEVDGEPIQVIAAKESLHVVIEDLRAIPQGQREAEVKSKVEQEFAAPFDLTIAPLFRITLFKLGEEEHILLLNMHHIISDGWSKGLLFKEFSTLYGAFLQNLPSPLPALELQYVDYAYWQQEYLQGVQFEEQLGYWRKQLHDIPALLELPTDNPRPAIMNQQGRRVFFQLPETLSTQLNDLCRTERVTLFQLLLAAFHVFLSRYCRQEDIVTGTPFAGRQLAEFEPLVGFFVNTLVLRSQVVQEEKFQDFLARVREMTLSAYQYQDIPFEKLVEVLNPQRSRAYSPLFQVMFIFQNTAPRALELSGVTIKPFEAENAFTKFDLTLSLEEKDGQLSGFFEYRIDLFQAATIERMAANLQKLLEGLAMQPEVQVGNLPLLSETEHRLLKSWNDTAMVWPKNSCIHQLFEEQVERTPEAVAVICEERILTYQELNSRANQLAYRLRRLGVGSDLLVGLFCERSLEMVIALLGILKAGGAYVALDPVLPPERLQYILADAQVTALVTQASLAGSLPFVDVPAICMDTDLELSSEATENPSSPVQPENLVYVIYTSGSTGKPKGVGIEHRQLLNYVLGLRERLDLAPGVLSYATVSTLSADLGNTAVFPALIFGGCLHVITQDRILSGELLADYCLRYPIDFLKITPSHLATLQNIPEPSRIMPRKLLVVGGEASRLQWVDNLRRMAPDCTIFNHYGPSETTIGVLTYRVTSDRPETTSSTLVLGRPIPNSQMHVVDADLRLVPIGVPGELLIGGANVGRGYLRRPELTKEKFISNPFGGGRLYRTGDLVRYLADGNIEFLGRLDDQIKIRGYRVEIGEVESVLGQHPRVKACAVLACDDGLNEKRLAAYVVGDHLDMGELRSHLRQTLPEFMVPSFFVQLSQLPITPNGKLNRQALPDPMLLVDQSERQHMSPRNELERRLAEIWQDVLKVDQIGIDDDFFDLGGHSLLAVRLFAKISTELADEIFRVRAQGGVGKKPGLRPSILWSASTIRTLAQLFEDNGNSGAQDRILMEVQRGKTGQTPFVLLTGDWGGLGFYVRNLARRLNTDQPVYALMPHDVTAEGAPLTIEDMAKAFLPTLRTAQPKGPYMLGGYSHAGLVAYEIAKLLQFHGEKVSLLFAIDTTMPDPRWRYLKNPICFMGRLLTWSTDKEVDVFLRWRYRLVHAIELWNDGILAFLAYYLRRFSGRRQSEAADSNGAPEGMEGYIEDKMTIGYIRATSQYVPAKGYQGRITLARSMEGPSARTGDPYMGWSRVCDDIQVLQVPGSHATCLTENLDVVAGHLRVCLDEALRASLVPSRHS